MRKLRAASVALLVVASTGLLFGSMGFSSVAADRGVSVAVADDDSALVGYDSEDLTVTDGERVDLVTVENRLASGASVANVSAASSNPEIRVSDFETPTLGTGDVGAVRAAVDCEPGAETTLTVSVTVEADGVTAAISGDTTTRSFEVSCAAATPEAGDVRFSGEGNVHFDDWSQATLNVTYWTDADDGFEKHGPVAVDATESLKSAVGGQGQTRFVAVYVAETDETHFHPGFDTATGEMNPGQGDQNATVVDGEQSPNDV